jgi:hypothetical protein
MGIHFPMDGLPCVTHQEADSVEVDFINDVFQPGRQFSGFPRPILSIQ